MLSVTSLPTLNITIFPSFQSQMLRSRLFQPKTAVTHCHCQYNHSICNYSTRRHLPRNRVKQRISAKSPEASSSILFDRGRDLSRQPLIKRASNFHASDSLIEERG